MLQKFRTNSKYADNTGILLVKAKEQIGRIVKKEGVVITCSWNSGGIGKKYGFEIEEILLVPHGGWHNDTIVVVERKVI